MTHPGRPGAFLRVHIAVFSVSAVLCGAAAALALEPVAVRVVGRAGPGQPWTDGATEAQLADGAELALIVLGRETGRAVTVADEAIEPLLLGGKPQPAAHRRPWTSLGAVSVRWLKVEPHAWRESDVAARNGATTRFHTNVSMERGSFGQWLGFDEITYFETPLSGWSPAAEARRRPALEVPGTLRYAAEARFDDLELRPLRSPGASDVDLYGISPVVHRVSLRLDDSFVGHLSSYFLVPEVFGSAGPGRNHQTERYTGADCADVLVGALRRMGYTEVPYSSVAALPHYTRQVIGPVDLDESGASGKPIDGVLRGDLIRIDYGGSAAGATPRSWDHVAVLYEDRSEPEGSALPNGRLDGFDQIVHMGHPQLLVEPLSRQAPARIDVLRWDPARLGKREKQREARSTWNKDGSGLSLRQATRAAARP